MRATTHLAELVEANNDATLEELRYLLYGKIGFSVSRATIGKMIKTLKHYCQKKLSSLQAKAQCEFKSCDVSSGKQLKRLVLKDLIFIDESGVNLAMVRLYARSLKVKGPRDQNQLNVAKMSP
jgi:hypothetical protein